MNIKSIFSRFYKGNMKRSVNTFKPEFEYFTKIKPEIIEIRQAALTDVAQIWELLHAEGLSWNDEMIEKNLSNLFVMTYSGKIIAVLHAFILINKLCQNWTAVHPMYPEKAVAAAIYYSVSSTVLRQADELLSFNHSHSVLQDNEQNNFELYNKKSCLLT